MIKSVAKAPDVFSPSEPRLTLAEISRRLEFPKSTAHRLLATLLAAGYVERLDGDQYALGTAVLKLTQSVRVNVELRDRAAPLLRELAGACRESVYLSILDGGYCLYTFAVESSRRLRARTAVGDSAHAHCTGVGKAMLAYLHPEKLEQITSEVGLPAFTPNTITDPDALRQRLREIRKQGYALDDGEHEPGIACIAAPIFNQDEEVIAACSMASTNTKAVREQEAELSAQVVHTAQELSSRMGYVPSSLRFINGPAAGS